MRRSGGAHSGAGRRPGFVALRAVVPVLLAVAAGCPREPAEPVLFEDVTKAAGLPDGSLSCLVFDDLDRDGWPDVVLAPIDTLGRFGGDLVVYRNRGDGTFEPRRLATTLSQVLHCAAGDLDGDGWPDLAVSGRQAEASPYAVLNLYRNLGELAFEDVSASVRPLLVDPPRVVGVFDADVDGLPDLLIGSFEPVEEFTFTACHATADDLQCPMVPPSPGSPLLLLRNLGAFRFERAAHQLPGSALHCAFTFVDWDADGRTDVFVSNDHGPNQFHRNTPDGFVEVLAGWGANPYNNGMGAAFADFDQDGALDVYVADVGPNQVWFGTGDWEGGVTNRSLELGVADATRFAWSWTPIAADFDGDGLPDVFVPISAILHDADDVLRVLRNEPISGLPAQHDLLLGTRAGRPMAPGRVAHRSGFISTDAVAASADFDRDGRRDVLVVIASELFEIRLLRNVIEPP